jgi:hypothetical protein
MLCLAAIFCIKLRGGSVGNALGEVVPANVLLGAEIRTVEKFLQAKYFDFLFRRLLDQLEMLVDHGFLDLGQRAVARRARCSPESDHSARFGT